MSKAMRAKVQCTRVVLERNADGVIAQETVIFRPVSRSGSYPEDGTDEDNTYAKFSPSGEFNLTIANPALLDTYRPGQKFYVDFTPID